MIVSKKNKVVIFLVPKTGTYTLCKTFYDKGLDECAHSHENYSAICKRRDFSQYTMFAFYRDPVERAVSMLRYIKRWRTHDFFHAFYGNEIKMSSFGDNPYEDLSPELKALNDSVSLIEVFRTMTHHRNNVYRKQVHWLNFPDMQLLDFRNYDEEVQKLAEILDINISEIDIGNPSLKIEHLDNLTKDDIQEIKNYYTEDYMYLKERGIKWQE
jgi:hypothetical protein